MIRSLQIKLVVKIVLPLIDAIRARIETLEASGIAESDRHDLQALLDLFPPDFPNTGVINVGWSDAPAVLRASSLLRLHLRATDLAEISDEAMEKGSLPKWDAHERDRTSGCFMFLATIQQLLLDNISPRPSLLTQIGKLFHRSRGSAQRRRPSNDEVWQVVVRNDPVNLMAYVTHVFEHTLGLPRIAAQRHMREVHELKRTVVWAGPRAKAEAYVNTLRTWHLETELEPSDL